MLQLGASQADAYWTTHPDGDELSIFLHPLESERREQELGLWRRGELE